MEIGFVLHNLIFLVERFLATANPQAEDTEIFLTQISLINTVFARLAFSVNGILDASICDALLPGSQNPERHGLICLSRAKNTDFLYLIILIHKQRTQNSVRKDSIGEHGTQNKRIKIPYSEREAQTNTA